MNIISSTKKLISCILTCAMLALSLSSPTLYAEQSREECIKICEDYYNVCWDGATRRYAICMATCTIASGFWMTAVCAAAFSAIYISDTSDCKDNLNICINACPKE